MQALLSAKQNDVARYAIPLSPRVTVVVMVVSGRVMLALLFDDELVHAIDGPIGSA